MASMEQLQHEYDTTRGLWCIDRNPTDVDYEWIKENAFQLKDHLQISSDERDNPGGIAIGRFTLKQAKSGKIWMAGPSGEGTEVD